MFPFWEVPDGQVIKEVTMFLNLTSLTYPGLAFWARFHVQMHGHHETTFSAFEIKRKKRRHHVNWYIPIIFENCCSYGKVQASWSSRGMFLWFNILAVFFCRITGLYTKTLAKIILHDVTRFVAVFIVIFFSFSGALTLSLCYSDENQQFRWVSTWIIAI